VEFQYYGANCIRITTKTGAVTIDGNLKELGRPSPIKANDIALFTSAHGDPEAPTRIAIDSPGEYEVADISIQGIAARAHIDEEQAKSAVIYRITVNDIKVAAVGHIYPELSDDQLELIGTIDVLLIPVGGNGYTLDPIGALKVAKKIEPKIIIPTHYADSKINYPVPQQDLETVLKNMALEAKETVPKLKIKALEPSDSMQLVVLERQ
jgi:L-ascorbate metabolism protein UlaG (beta-lactamase superfamily)